MIEYLQGIVIGLFIIALISWPPIAWARAEGRSRKHKAKCRKRRAEVRNVITAKEWVNGER